jgi:RHH-type proline utilization regulon transcriptional repressor/proline dehydrogenase/delta 1-pyrroline-5-carboxylate dehydrogenase
MNPINQELNFKAFQNAPLMNFSLGEDRQKMEKALQKVRSEFGRSYRLKTGEIITKNDRCRPSLNPSNPSEILGYVEYGNREDAQKALTTAYEASLFWKQTAAMDRAKMLENLADWMEARRCELSAWMVYEVGKNWREADADTCEAIDFCRYYAREMMRLSKPIQTQNTAGELNLLTYHPKGVSVVIAPWNFPLAILAGMTVASLVTGNTCIFKPAEQSMVIAALLAQGLKESGFPENVFYFLPGIGEEVGPTLTNDERVDVIVFTGSAEVGLSIIETTAKKPGLKQRGVKKVIAEMGGKNALIIDEDADMDEALQAAIHSAFGFQGQKCSALSRLLIHSKVYDSFVTRFVEASKSLRVGPSDNPEYQMGPVIDETAQKRILKTIEDGATRMKVLFQQTNVPTSGYFVPATIFECNDRSEPLFQNEIFGPVVCVKKFSTLDEAFDDVNSVRFALTGGIFSRSPSHIQKAKERMEVGNLYINRAITGATVQRHPFGGFKLSGVGSKAGGPDYLLQFLEPRTFSENMMRRGFVGES